MKIEWLIANVTAVGFPARSESVFRLILTFFDQINRYPANVPKKKLRKEAERNVMG